MVSDYNLYLISKTELKGYSNPECAEILAERFSLSADSVRSRLSRANTVSNRVRVSKDLQEYTEQNKSILRQEQVIKESNEQWDFLNNYWAGLNRPIVGYFISDKHLGAPQRYDYWELTLKILDGEEHVDVWSGLNDWQDNEGWGRHDDERRPAEKLWSEDVQNAFDAEDYDYNTLYDITGSKGVGVLGNHDSWYYKRVRSSTKFNGEKLTADRMTELYDNNLLLFNRMNYENHIELGEHLVWTHGTRTAAKRASSRARVHMFNFMTDYGQARSVVVGHSHRPILLKGTEIDYKGVYFANSGTYLDNTNVGYAVDKKGVGWYGGIVRCEFHPTSRKVNLALIEFQDRGGLAVAIKNGTEIANTTRQ